MGRNVQGMISNRSETVLMEQHTHCEQQQSVGLPRYVYDQAQQANAVGRGHNSYNIVIQ